MTGCRCKDARKIGRIYIYIYIFLQRIRMRGRRPISTWVTRHTKVDRRVWLVWMILRRSDDRRKRETRSIGNAFEWISLRSCRGVIFSSRSCNNTMDSLVNQSARGLSRGGGGREGGRRRTVLPRRCTNLIKLNKDYGGSELLINVSRKEWWVFAMSELPRLGTNWYFSHVLPRDGRRSRNGRKYRKQDLPIVRTFVVRILRSSCNESRHQI